MSYPLNREITSPSTQCESKLKVWLSTIFSVIIITFVYQIIERTDYHYA